MTRSKQRVLLVKEPRSSGSDARPEEDPYEARLSPYFDVDFLPVLAHRLTNLVALRDIIAAGSHGNYGGVIVTSQRAVLAWQKAVASLAEDGGIDADAERAAPLTSKAFSQAQHEDRVPDLGWHGHALPFYVVGPATGSQLAAMTSSTAATALPSKALILGSDTGNAESLAQFICAHQSNYCQERDPPSRALPLLYLVGDKRRITITKALQETSKPITVRELEVYETYPSPTFSRDFETLVQQHDGDYAWIVFFSPSGVKLVREQLRQLPRSVRFVTIGPTTQAFMDTLSDIEVAAVAESPTPEALLAALLGQAGSV